MFTFNRYWIEQIGATIDIKETKPIIIVGTQANLLNGPQRDQLEREMNILYPTPNQYSSTNRSQILGHFTVDLSGEKGLDQLKEKIVDIGHNHPRIGIGWILVPNAYGLLQVRIDTHKSKSPYITWDKWVEQLTELSTVELQIFTTY